MTRISFYRTAFDTKQSSEYEVNEILFDIKNGKWQNEFFKISTEQDKEKRSELKKMLPAFTGSGVFSEGRKDENIKQHSGLIFLDIDMVEKLNETKALLADDPYTYAVFVSVSGLGLCWVVKIEPKRHADAFDGLFEYVYNKHLIRLDTSGRNISRLRFVSFDPNMYHNPDSIKFKEYVSKPRIAKKETTHLHVNSQFDKLIYKVTSDICGSYTGWFEVGCAIASKYGEDGLKYFEHISQYRQSSKHNFFQSEVNKQYSHCVRHSYNFKINTLYHYMKLGGYDIRNTELDFIAKTAYFAKDRGGNNAKNIMTIVRTVVPNDIKLLESEQEEIVQAVLDDPTFKPEGVAKLQDTDPIGDLIQYLKINYTLVRNEITKFIENDGLVLEENDFNSIYIDIKRKFDKIKYEDLTRVINSNETKTINPIIEYLKKLQFDGHDHLFKLTKSIKTTTGGADINWRCAMVTRWFVGMIENIHGGDCPLMFLLTGKQYTGKTSFFRQLLPNELVKYYGESQLNTGGVDDKLLMTQKLLIYDDEYSGKTKADSKMMKTLLSSKTFSMRAPYGRKNMDYKRLAVLCGTSNEDEILNDSTGNRRLIIFKVNEMIDWEIFNNIDKSQLLAQAYELYLKGHTSKIDIEDQDKMNRYTYAEHYETSIESEIIEKYFSKGDKKMGDALMTTEIYLHIKNQTKDHVIYQKKIGQELKRLGYQREFINGRYRYWVVKNDPDDYRNRPGTDITEPKKEMVFNNDELDF